MAETKVGVIIEAEDRASGVISSVKTSLGNLNESVKKLEPMFKTMAVAGTAAFGAIAGVGVTSLRAFADAEKDMVVASKAVENAINGMTDKQKMLYSETGNSADVMKEVTEAMSMASKAALKLGYDDEQASVAFAKFFQISQDVEQAQRDLQLAMDLSAFSGRDLASAQKAITMAYAGGTKVLKEFGIEVEEGANATTVFETITAKAGGTAQAMAQTVGGQMEIMKLQIGNLQEAIGGALAGAFTNLLTSVQPVVDKFVTFVENNPQLVTSVMATGAALAGLLVVVGTLGVALPAIVAGFTLLASPVALVVLAVTALIAAFIIFRSRVDEIFALVDEKTGLITVLKEAWANVSMVFTQNLLPALVELWNTLTPLKPFLEALGTVIGVTLVGLIYMLIKALEYGIIIFASVFEWITKIATAISGVFVGAINLMIAGVEKAIGLFEKLINLMKKADIGSAVKAATGKVKSLLSVDDAVISPSGQVVTTHPDDWLIATKNPASLGGGGGIVVNINGGNYLDRNAGLMLGDHIVEALRQQMRI